jgi:hypothetical protein
MNTASHVSALAPTNPATLDRWTRIEQFGTAGQASKIGKIRPLSEMAKLYAAGKLDPTFS